MSTLRLTFLYPHLFRSIRSTEPVAQKVRECVRHGHGPTSQAASFTTTSRKNQRFVQRHGKAVKPYLVEGETKNDTKVYLPEEDEDGSKNDGEDQPVSLAEPEAERKLSEDRDVSSAVPLSKETQDAAYIPGDSPEDLHASNVTTSAQNGLPAITPLQQAAFNTVDPNGPLETVLHMDPPTEPPLDAPRDDGVVHMHTPPYVHHFDSYTLVKGVEAGGFTPEQSVPLMKAVRGLLTYNLDIAKEGLVSKGDVENETYLFRAACSELRTEIQNTRKANDEKMRSERTLLQHELDILSQKLTQELLVQKDDLKSMFNDRKMAVRTEQRTMESAIQELNYKITVLLNSDSKSEVEGLRWVLTRRSVSAIVFMALMVLSSLRYASYRAHEEEIARKRLEKIKEQEASNRLHHRGVEMHDAETQTGDYRERGDNTPAGTAMQVLTAN